MKTGTRRWFVGLCLAGGLGVAACLSPTLPPLPPPSEPTMSYVGDGQLRLSGAVPAHRSTRVIAVNNRNNQLSGEVTDTGRYDFTLPAQPGDDIEFWYEVGAKVSDSVFVTAPPNSSAPMANSPAPPNSSAPPNGSAPTSSSSTESGPTSAPEPQTTLESELDAGVLDAATTTAE